MEPEAELCSYINEAERYNVTSFQCGTAMAKKKSAGAKYFGKRLTDDPDDAPELLNDFFRDGELRRGLIRRGRPPLSGKPKTAITFRLDEDVVKAYRETGEGWQTRINADLRRARKLTIRTATAPRGAKRGPAAPGQSHPNEKVGLAPAPFPANFPLLHRACPGRSASAGRSCSQRLRR
jgi:uncharacterized protein (DUF4415 family)